jgi:hypothetical protein
MSVISATEMAHSLTNQSTNQLAPYPDGQLRGQIQISLSLPPSRGNTIFLLASGANAYVDAVTATTNDIMASMNTNTTAHRRSPFLVMLAEWASVTVSILAVCCFVSVKFFDYDLSTLAIFAPIAAVVVGALVTFWLRHFLAD